MRDATLVALLVATVVALYVRPRQVRDWQIALTGGMLAWAAGPLWFRAGLDVLAESANILSFFLGLMLISAAIEVAGLYASVASLLARFGGRRGILLPVLILGSGVTAVLTNDATPLLLAPAVLVISREARASLLGVTFVADGASLLLPVSNPVNLLFYERLNISFERWSTEILPAAVAGIVVLSIVHARTAGAERIAAVLPASASLPGPAWYRRFVGSGAIALGATYVGASIAGLPLGAVSLVGGIVLAAPALAGRVATARGLGRHVSPGLFAFVAGLLLLVDSGQAAGVFGPVASVLDWTADRPAPVTVLVAAAAAALLSNLMNNWPAALLVSAAIGATAEPSHQLVAGALVGCTIGANFTVVGSLSTFFWLTLLRVHGVSPSPSRYARAAFWPTLAGMAAACAVAAVTTL